MWNNKLGALALCTFMGFLSLGAAPANAEPVENVQSQTRVTYGDLDLSTHEGSVTLQRRVSEAIESVCERPLVNWNDSLKARQCENKAVAETRPQVALALRNAKEALAMNRAENSIIIR